MTIDFLILFVVILLCLGIGILLGKYIAKKTKVLEKIEQKNLNKIVENPDLLIQKMTKNGDIKIIDMGEELEFSSIDDPNNPGRKILDIKRKKVEVPELIKEKEVNKHGKINSGRKGKAGTGILSSARNNFRSSEAGFKDLIRASSASGRSSKDEGSNKSDRFKFKPIE